MKKKIIACMMFVVLAFYISGCSSEKSSEPKQAANETELPEETVTEAPEVENVATEEPIIERTATAKSEAYGYEMEYNPDFFEYYNSEGIDNFTPVDGALEQEGTIYVVVQRLKNSDAKSVAESFQIGSDTELEEVKVGVKDYKAKYVYVANEIDGTVQYVKRYVVQHKKDVFLIEVSGYEGMDENVLEALEKMIGSFRIG